MKKILTLAVIAGLSGITAFAQTTVSSANVVGYVKIPQADAGQYTLVSVTQFNIDGSTNDTFDLQTVISNLEDLNADGVGSAAAGADKIYVWTGSGYTQYALFEEAGQGGPYWAALTENGWDPTLASYGLTNVNPANVEIDLGKGVWYSTDSSKTIGFSKIYTLD